MRLPHQKRLLFTNVTVARKQNSLWSFKQWNILIGVKRQWLATVAIPGDYSSLHSLHPIQNIEKRIYSLSLYTYIMWNKEEF